MKKACHPWASLAACLALVSSSALADETPASAKPEGEAAPKTVCVKERPTGSRRVVKVCRSASDIADSESESERVIDRTKHYGNVGYSPPGA